VRLHSFTSYSDFLDRKSHNHPTTELISIIFDVAPVSGASKHYLLLLDSPNTRFAEEEDLKRASIKSKLIVGQDSAVPPKLP